MASPRTSKGVTAKRPQAEPTQSLQRRRAAGFSSKQRSTFTRADDAQPQPTVDPLTRRMSGAQLQPDAADPDDTVLRPDPDNAVLRPDPDDPFEDELGADQGTTGMTRPEATRNENVARVQTFLQRRDLAQSPQMTAALANMQRVVDAHGSSTLDDTDLRIALADIDMIQFTGRPMVSIEEALKPRPTVNYTPETFKVVVDGEEITSFNARQIQELQTRCFGSGSQTDTRALGLVMAGCNFNGSTQELVDLVSAVHRRLPVKGTAKLVTPPTKLDGDPKLIKLAAQLLEQQRFEQDQLTKVISAAGLAVEVPAVTASQAQAVRVWLKQHPQYLGNLKTRGLLTKVVLGSGTSLGDFFNDGPGQKSVHVADLPDKPADAYLRILVHETGHAGFQRALLGTVMNSKNPWFNGQDAAGLKKFGEELRARSVRARTGEPDPPPSKEVLAGEKVWGRLSPQAQRYYQAWMTLGQAENRKFLIGVDQGRESNTVDIDQANRQAYQADTFIELCAEGFATLAMGDLDRHVAVIDSRPDVPAEVKAAWQDVQSVLHELGDPLLGRV